MASSNESGQETATHSFWPKVILWLVIIIFGFLYIRSIAKMEQTASADEGSAAVVEQAPRVGRGRLRVTPEGGGTTDSDLSVFCHLQFRRNEYKEVAERGEAHHTKQALGL